MLTAHTSPIWANCALAGSYNCGSGRPAPIDPDVDAEKSEAQREGIAAEWVAQQVLRGDAGSPHEMLGEQAPNGWLITSEMVAHATTYCDLVQSHGVPVEVEKPMQIGDLISVRADAHAVTIDGVLNIYDLKYGRRVVEDYTPLICAAVALWSHGLREARLTIFQPRPYHPDGPVRTMVLSAADVGDWRHMLTSLAHAALAPDAVGRPGSWCTDCAGIGPCYAAQKTVYAMFETLEDGRGVQLTPAQLADELKFLKLAEALVKARKGALDAEAVARMKRGEYVPNQWLEPRLGNRQFHVSMQTVEQLTGIHPYKQVPLSPAELEAEGALTHIVELLTSRPDAGVKLAPLTQKTFERMFGKRK
jgi:hypothetical protein